MTARLSHPTVPGPRPLFGLGWRGNALRYGRDPLGHLTRLFRTYGDVVALTCRGNGNLTSTGADCPGTVFAFGAEHNRTVLSNTNDFHLSTRIGLEGSPYQRLGAGMFNMNGAKHREQRRLLLPAFHRDRAAPYHRDVVALTDRCLDRWRPGPCDIAAALRDLTLRIACRALFGLDEEEADELGDVLQAGLRLARSPGVLFFPWNLPFSPYGRFLSVARRTDQALCRLIARRRAEGASGKDVLSMLVAARDSGQAGLTEDELVGQANALFLAAHETTASALSWALLLLVQHPSALANLLDELRARLGGAAPSIEDLEALPVLDGVVKESLRLLPPVPISTRVVAGPAELGAYPLAPATEVHLSIYHTHRTEAFAHPARFRPDRWERLSPTPYEYLPFGAGPRLCVGAGFALVEIKVVLAMLLQRSRLSMLPGACVDHHVGITLAPRRGLPMIVAPADGSPAARDEVRGSVRELVEWSS